MDRNRLKRDANNVPAMGGIDTTDPTQVLPLEIDPATGRLLVTAIITSGGGGGGDLATSAKGTTAAGNPTSTNASADRQLLDVILRDSSGNALAVGGGTQYTDGDADSTPTGNAILGFDGTNLRAVTTDAAGDLQVDILTLPTVTVQATNLDIRDLSSASDSVSVPGVATEANQTTIIGHLDGVEALLTTIDADTSTIAGAIAGTEMQVDVLTMPTVTVNAVNLDIRDLSSATDSVTVTGTVGVNGVVEITNDSGNPIPVNATDFDIRNLVFATDKVDVSGSTLGANSGVDIGDVTVNGLPNDTYSVVSVDATTIGDTNIATTTAGQTLRLYYICLSANGANSADVTVTIKLGATTMFKISLKAGAIWARNIGAGRRYIAGALGEDLLVTLSAAQTVHVSAEYEIL